MGDNGKILINADKEPEKPPEPQVLEMKIIAEIGKPMQILFPLLGDNIFSYGFLKMAEKVLDNFYNQKPKIIQPKGGIMDFIRHK